MMPYESCTPGLTGRHSQIPVLLLDHHYLPQELVLQTLKNYSRLRDFHKNPPLRGPLIHHAYFIASAMNATLIATRTLNGSRCPNEHSNMPTFYYQIYGVELEDAYRRIRKIEGTRSFETLRFPVPWNFVICHHPRQEQQNLSPMEIFKTRMDASTWSCLGISLLLISVLISLKTGSTGSPVIMTLLASLLNPGISAVSRILQRSWLFNLWLYSSLVFITYFSGSLTSTVISPSKEVRITNLVQLADNNYSAIFKTTKDRLRCIKVAKIISNSRESKIVERLAGSAFVAPENTDFSNSLVAAEGHAYLSIWILSMHTVTRANEYLEKMKISHKHCYVGEELYFQEKGFFVVTFNREHEKVAKLLEVLMESGIYNIWYKEYVGIAISHRVQDRSKMISRTKLIEERKQLKALQMADGKLQNVFLLWITSLSICLLICSVEYLFAACKILMKLIYYVIK